MDSSTSTEDGSADLVLFYRTCLDFKPSVSSHEDLCKLVCTAYELRHTPGRDMVLHTILEPKIREELWSLTCFLGRLRSAFMTFIHAALHHGSFAHLKIDTIPIDKTRFKAPSTVPSLAQTMGLLGLETTSQTIEAHVTKRFKGKKPQLAKIADEFRFRQKRHGYIHAEIQIVMFLLRNSLYLPLRYIGCSRYSCFMCKAFLKQLEPWYSTRGCHGKLYYKWYLPKQVDGSPRQVQDYSDALRRLYQMLESELLKPITGSIPHVPESSAGGTVISSLPGYNPDQVDKLQRVLQEAFLENPSAFQTSNADAPILSATSGVPKPAVAAPNTQRVHATDKHAVMKTAVDVAQGRRIEAKSSLPADELASKCNVCDQPTTRRCSRCSGDFFCSSGCEAKAFSTHKFRCTDPLTSADHLEQACIEDEFPEDIQTLDDFKFSNFLRGNDRSKLLGLYTVLIKRCEVSASTLNTWLTEKSLTKGIIQVYECIPEPYRGGYFRWFLGHLDTFNSQQEAAHAKQVHCMDQIARLYLSKEDRDKRIDQMEPAAKQLAFHYLLVALTDYHPSPELQPKLYFDFGFVTCSSKREEGELGVFYARVLRDDKRGGTDSFWTDVLPRDPPSHFLRFWKASESNSLPDFFREQGFGQELNGRKFRHLEQFLSGFGRPSVWDLMMFLHQPTLDPPLPVFVDYAFIRCTTIETKRLLKERYREVLREADPLEFHEACMRGELFAYCGRYINLTEDFRMLMGKAYSLEE